MVSPLRGEVRWYAGPSTATERTRKRRPVLVLSTDTANTNEFYLYVTVAPISSNIERIYPLELELEGLSRPSKVQPQYLYTCRKTDLVGEALLRLEPQQLRAITERLKSYLEL